ncbi:hypothetical protein [Microbacterium sp.]|uniref:hypothetical protein n=1 Tax=Microbacterium sp. TaxID=51671 RepID=UPI0039E28D99
MDALDAVAREMRTANMIETLRAGTSLLDHNDLSKAKTPETRARQERLNVLRAAIRRDLGLEVGGDE